MKIPRIIHRIWLGEPVPANFVRFGDAWKELHPGWEIIDHQELPLNIHLPVEFFQARKLCPEDWKRWESDVLRLVLLRDWGGVYADMDIEPHRNLEPLLGENTCLVGRSPQHHRGVHPVTNAFMASVPNHAFVERLITTLSEGAKFEGNLARRIGPWHLTRTLQMNDYRDVTVVGDLYSQGWFTHYWNTKRRKKGEGLG